MPVGCGLPGGAVGVIGLDASRPGWFGIAVDAADGAAGEVGWVGVVLAGEVAGPVGGTISDVGRGMSGFGAVDEPVLGASEPAPVRSAFSVGDAGVVGVELPTGAAPSDPGFVGLTGDVAGVVFGVAVDSPPGRGAAGEAGLGVAFGRPGGVDVDAVFGDGVPAGWLGAVTGRLAASPVGVGRDGVALGFVAGVAAGFPFAGLFAGCVAVVGAVATGIGFSPVPRNVK